MKNDLSEYYNAVDRGPRETEEEKIARLLREKAKKRNEKIDQILEK